MRTLLHPSRLYALLAAGVVSMALLPGTAGAASVSEASRSLSYASASGEANDVTIAPWGPALQVPEAGGANDGKSPAGALAHRPAGPGRAGRKPIALTAGTGCWRLSKDSAACA